MSYTVTFSLMNWFSKFEILQKATVKHILKYGTVRYGMAISRSFCNVDIKEGQGQARTALQQKGEIGTGAVGERFTTDSSIGDGRVGGSGGAILTFTSWWYEKAKKGLHSSRLRYKFLGRQPRILNRKQYVNVAYLFLSLRTESRLFFNPDISMDEIRWQFMQELTMYLKTAVFESMDIKFVY